jgi:hypothetical protein
MRGYYWVGWLRRSVANSTVKAWGADGGMTTEMSPVHSFFDHASSAPPPVSAPAAGIA